MSGCPRPAAARRRRLTASVAAAVIVAAGALASSDAVAAAAHGPGPHVQPALVAPANDIGYAVSKPLCAAAVKPGQMTCFAMRRVPVAKGTPGAYPYLMNDGLTLGPAHGYTPADLAILYDYNPKVSRSTQTVGIVDWFDDPHVTRDLDAFDHHYHLRAETSRSFRVVNQRGAKAPLPSAARGKLSAGETSLDVETVRSVCQTCRILLVEATTPDNHDVGVAENTAVRLGATEVSNSFGGPEGFESSSTVAAFNHPGVVITASTGDDGWYDWDRANLTKGTSGGVAEFPSTDPDVVSVGGTGFPKSGKVNKQYVWNSNGPDDEQGLFDREDEGAGGGGCSQHYAAKSWQVSLPAYQAAGCGGMRLAADVSSLADPATGFDTYTTWGPPGETGWGTVGGTSLASPLIAAMFALAGGSGGAAYPAQSLYVNAGRHPSSLTDITLGGNGFCGGDTIANCEDAVTSDFGVPNPNPNARKGGVRDCSFPRDGGDPVTPPPASSECNAAPGYDGPSGLGTPVGIGLFAPTSPRISLTVPKTLHLNTPATFTAHATARLAGADITTYSFAWGDGHVTSGTSATATHSYGRGSHTLTLSVTDSDGQRSVSRRTITLGKRASIKLFGSASIKAGHKDRFRAVVVDPNTDATIRSVRWTWGDHHASRGTRVLHVWRKPGKYRITVTVTDSAGIETRVAARVTVKS